MSEKIQRFDFNGSSNVGAFCQVTDHWVLQSPSDEPTKHALETLFETTTTITTIGQSTLVGILMVGNKNGLLVPHLTVDEELEFLQNTFDTPVITLSSKLTALGNLILTNDQAALISPAFNREEKQTIRDALNVEVEARTLAGSDLVGSYCVATNRGILVHRDVSEEELEWLINFFGGTGELGTINCGVPYVSIGLLATSRAAAAGFETTGPELMRISEAFFP